MVWSLAASGTVVGEALGTAAAAAEPEAKKLGEAALAGVEQELVTELRKVLSNPRFRTLAAVFTGDHTPTITDLHVPPAAAPPATDPAPAADSAAPAAEQAEQPEPAAVSGDGGD